MLSKSHSTIRGKTVRDVLRRARDETKRHGEVINIDSGQQRVIQNITLVLEEVEASQETNKNFKSQDRYPYWNKSAEEWYMNEYVRLAGSSSVPQEYRLVFPFTYATRARAHNDGWENALQVVQLLQQHNYSGLPFSRVDDINQLVRETYKNIHPDLLLTVMVWLSDNLASFIEQPQLLEIAFQLSRRDSLMDVANDLARSPQSITSVPTLAYSNIDTLGLLTNIPNYQSYHVQPVFDSKLNFNGLQSYSLRRSCSASGSAQLEFTHDLEWGTYLAQQTNVPLKQISIHVQQLYLDEDLAPSSNIRDWLLGRTNGYAVDQFDIEGLIGTDEYQRKVARVLEVLE